jgi:hypothetical protein
MRFDLASSADPGARSGNDDRLVLVEHRRLIAGIVADGALGHGNGDVAAQLDVVKIRLTGEEPLFARGHRDLNTAARDAARRYRADQQRLASRV